MRSLLVAALFVFALPLLSVAADARPQPFVIVVPPEAAATHGQAMVCQANQCQGNRCHAAAPFHFRQPDVARRPLFRPLQRSKRVFVGLAKGLGAVARHVPHPFRGRR
jgi:hypothetical protein